MTERMGPRLKVNKSEKRPFDEVQPTNASSSGISSSRSAKLSCGHTQKFNPNYNSKPTWLNCMTCGSARRVVGR